MYKYKNIINNKSYKLACQPRYTGCPSARVNITGGRYDYRFDAHDRLVQADYTPGAGAAKGEDFSVVYSYDAMARPTRVRRSGIIDMDADGTESFGYIDVLQYSYDQAGRVAAIDNDPEGVDYYGRPGFPSCGSEYDWDAAGRMTADTGRGISLIKYDHRNLPKDIAFGDGRHINNFYDADGALIRTVLIPRGIVGTGYHPTVRTYAADRVWEDSKLLYSYFPGGYFDADGHVHYLHNDYQGSVVLVTDSAGTVEQRNTYYPYGEPHRTPAGQPRLYAGKERMAVTGEYDYGARQHFAPGLLWSVPDAMAEKYYPISPYVFCNGNPIRNIDKDGNDVFVLNYGYGTNQHMAMLIQNDDKSWSYYSVNGNNVYASGSHSGGRKFNDVQVGKWDSPQEFLDSDYNSRPDDGDGKDDKSVNNFGYEEGYLIESTPEQDEIMREEFKKISDTEYDLLNNNCATAVQKTLIKGGFNVNIPTSLVEIVLYLMDHKEDVTSTIPSNAYLLIQYLNDGTKIKKGL